MWCCASLSAQRHIVFSDDIASLQVVAGTRWQDLPIIKLNGNERINISFDEMSHTYRRLTYTITHLDYDFSESESLFASDYIDGFHSGQTIDDYEHSINTLQNYTHYHLQIPNADCKLKMSGNYRIDIFDDDNENDTLLSAFFMVNEDITNLSVNYTADTDIDTRRNHQQVLVKLDYAKVGATDPERQIRGYIIQNNRWDNATVLPKATRRNQQYMEWLHNRELIFDAGNEYHKFEILDVHRNSMNVEQNSWDGNTWHTYLWYDYNRPSYVYDEKPKGAFYIRNSDNSENDITSEYVNVHFTLKTEKINIPIYINGMWTNDWFTDDYQMTYNEELKQYEACIPMKYGYYSYQYLCVDTEGNTHIPPSEGSFYETRNCYNALIYYRGNADRTDRLIAFR